MADLDIQKFASEFAKSMREDKIKQYREFYEKNLEPLESVGGVSYKVHSFLKGLEKQPHPNYDPAFTKLIDEIGKYVKSTFREPLQKWFEEPVPEVVNIKREDSLYYFRSSELSWLQHRSKLMDLTDKLRKHGLHPDIEKRDAASYGRYNVVIQYSPPNVKKHRKECKPLMPLVELEQQVLLPWRSQKPLQLNGSFFEVATIKRITITVSLLLDEELRLYKAKHRCHTDLDFCNCFPEVTDKMIHNPHLEESQATDSKAFVTQSRIDGFRAYKGNAWDMAKLILLCEELNHNYQAGNFYSVAYLSRALIDHIPPILGHKNFDEVANNYGGDKSFRKAMEHLNKTLKNIADLHIHKAITPKLAIPSLVQVDFRQDFDLLLGELLAKI